MAIRSSPADENGASSSLRTLRGFNRPPGYIGRYTSFYRFTYSQRAH
jgi:hypothetical protein